MRFLCLTTLWVAAALVGCAESTEELDEVPSFVNTGECFDPDAVPYGPPYDVSPEFEPRSCLHGGDCEPGEYCNKSPSCKGEGVCASGEQVCAGSLFEYPVCTCSGFNSLQLCGASGENRSLTGCSECPVCETNDDCGSDQFCNAWFDCAGPGGCGVRPEHCQDIDEPVCGCDGVAYRNECEAWAAGVRVAGPGSCDCYETEDCPSGEYCVARTCDGPGVCKSEAEECDVDFPIKRTVCGCDGVFYWDECRAARAGAKLGDAQDCEWPPFSNVVR